MEKHIWVDLDKALLKQHTLLDLVIRRGANDFFTGHWGDLVSLGKNYLDFMKGSNAYEIIGCVWTALNDTSLEYVDKRARKGAYDINPHFLQAVEWYMFNEEVDKVTAHVLTRNDKGFSKKILDYHNDRFNEHIRSYLGNISSDLEATVTSDLLLGNPIFVPEETYNEAVAAGNIITEENKLSALKRFIEESPLVPHSTTTPTYFAPIDELEVLRKENGVKVYTLSESYLILSHFVRNYLRL